MTTIQTCQKSVTSFLSNFALLRITPGRSPSPILSLNFDIFIDQIFIYLHVEDIICLRRVNKLFFLLTHEPIIWKRFLERMNLPLPPLRPSYRYSLRRTDFEVEQMVTRAISLDDNWRNHNTKVLSHKVLSIDKIILEMKLLPGGKYLVTSETDEKNYRYYITIYALDHPHGFMPLARADTEVRAFHIQAKYLKYHGEQGIFISCTRRKFRQKAFPWLDPSTFSPDAEIDTPIPFDYEVLCFHTSLDHLELVADPEIRRGTQQYYDRVMYLGPPFRSIAYMGSRHRMDLVTLFEYNEQPFVAFVQQPDRIIIKNIDTGVRSVLQCRPAHDHPDKPHKINALRALPGQKDLFVIRTVDLTDADACADPEARPLYLIEIFDMPVMGEKLCNNPREQAGIDDKHISSFVVCDNGIPTLGPDHPKLRPFCGPPPPISIFARTIYPNGIIHYKLWPEHIAHPPADDRPARITYRYTLNLFDDQSFRLTNSFAAHVLPGTDRAVIYHVPDDDRTDSPPLINLKKYIDPGYRPPEIPDPDEDVSNVLRKPRPAVPHKVFADVKMPSIWSKKLGKGLSAITWDEGIGRVCISAKNEKFIRVLDFAHAIQPDARFASWKKQQGYS